MDGYCRCIKMEWVFGIYEESDWDGDVWYLIWVLGFGY